MIDKGGDITSKRGYKQTCNNWTGEHTCESPLYIGKGFRTRVNERESAQSWESNWSTCMLRNGIGHAEQCSIQTIRTTSEVKEIRMV